MNILLINHYAGSVYHGMEFRPHYLAREWVKHGHHVNIVAASYSHVRTNNPEMAGLSRTDEMIDGIHYTWLSTPLYKGNGIWRLLNITAFICRLYRQSNDIASRTAPDAVIASSTYPLDIFPARRIARQAKARLFFEVHDLWPLSPIELGGYSRWHPFMMLLQFAENHACRNADAVVSILPNAKEHLEKHGMAPKKLHVVVNGADAAEWNADTPAPPLALSACLFSIQSSGLFIVGYTGSHGPANALIYFLDAAYLLRDHPVAFVLVGGGSEKSKLQDRALALGLSKVYFFDAIPKSQVPELLRRIDLTYIGWQRQPLYRFGISPNKLVDYMMAGRPILHAVEAGNDLVGDARCGVTITPENPEKIADAILDIMIMSPEARSEMGQRGRRFALENLSYSVLGRRFLHVLSGDNA